MPVVAGNKVAPYMAGEGRSPQWGYRLTWQVKPFHILFKTKTIVETGVGL